MTAHPNPVRDQTLISYQLTGSAHVNGCIYDAAGNLVTNLVAAFEAAGPHQVTWNASGVMPGIYFFKLIAGNESSSARLLKVN